MSEPEELIIDAAEYATNVALSLWRRYNDPKSPDLVLEEVARRLELLNSALFDVSLTVAVADPPVRPNIFARLFGTSPAHLFDPRAMPATDGRHLRLPHTLEELNADAARARYRLWAGEQALRAARNSPAVWSTITDAPARALFWLAEAAACDCIITETCPGWVDLIIDERRDALARRPPLDLFSPPERAVEERCRALLECPPAQPPTYFPRGATCEELREWALSQATSLPDGPWRGLPAVRLWGALQPPEAGNNTSRGDAKFPDDTAKNNRNRQIQRRPRVREPEDDEDDDGQGTWMVPVEDYHESVQDPMGLQRPTDHDDDASLDDLADSLSNLDQARLVIGDEPARETLQSNNPLPRAPIAPPLVQADGVRFPEWDWRTATYIEPGTVVRTQHAPPGDALWAADVLRRHAVLIEQVRRCFAQLRPRRVRLNRQPDGDEIDIPAYVEAHADRAAGQPPSSRIYQRVRPHRRDVAISLLVDISASTDSWVGETRRIIDVEKEALLVLCEALDALGDPYGISAFSGHGPQQVSIRSLKDFDEPYATPVRRRISALEPDRYTRAGAAIRHATALLANQRARHRLLLILSDGKPNDLDLYEGRYGVEDTRQAVVEARLQELDVFCLTIDRRAPAYMPRIYGPGAFAVLRHPELLPRVLVDIVRRLLAG